MVDIGSLLNSHRFKDDFTDWSAVDYTCAQTVVMIQSVNTPKALYLIIYIFIFSMSTCVPLLLHYWRKMPKTADKNLGPDAGGLIQ